MRCFVASVVSKEGEGSFGVSPCHTASGSRLFRFKLDGGERELNCHVSEVVGPHPDPAKGPLMPREELSVSRSVVWSLRSHSRWMSKSFLSACAKPDVAQRRNEGDSDLFARFGSVLVVGDYKPSGWGMTALSKPVVVRGIVVSILSFLASKFRNRSF